MDLCQLLTMVAEFGVGSQRRKLCNKYCGKWDSFVVLFTLSFLLSSFLCFLTFCHVKMHTGFHLKHTQLTPKPSPPSTPFFLPHQRQTPEKRWHLLFLDFCSPFCSTLHPGIRKDSFIEIILTESGEVLIRNTPPTPSFCWLQRSSLPTPLYCKCSSVLPACMFVHVYMQCLQGQRGHLIPWDFSYSGFGFLGIEPMSSGRPVSVLNHYIMSPAPRHTLDCPFCLVIFSLSSSFNIPVSLLSPVAHFQAPFSLSCSAGVLRGLLWVFLLASSLCYITISVISLCH